MHQKLFTAILVSTSVVLLSAQPSRIPARAKLENRTVLSNHIHPRTRTAADQGRMMASAEIQGISLVLKPSATQQAGLDQLLSDQQNPRSSTYHQWLTPEQFAERFGVSADDVTQIRNWLESQGFTVGSVARARNSISFSGTVAQVESAFATELHTFDSSGEVHFANVTNPYIPVAFASVVQSVRGLNDFRPKA